jgi:hypothetical protein
VDSLPVCQSSLPVCLLSGSPVCDTVERVFTFIISPVYVSGSQSVSFDYMLAI